MRLRRCLFASKQRLLFESPALFEGVNIIRMGVNIVRMHSEDLVDLQENSSVESLCFFNGYCLAGGSVYTEWNESGSPTSSKAVQWIVNDRTTAMQDFSIGCIGKSQLNLLMNYEDRFLFQGVRHDGGFQICQDGALLEEIKTPKGFNANAWEVTVEKVPVQ